MSGFDYARAIDNSQLAAELYRTVLNRDTRNAPIWVAYGSCLKQSDDLAGAENAYRTAIICDPSNVEPYRLLGDLLKNQGRDKEANASYLIAAALDPSSLSSTDAPNGFGWSQTQLATVREMLESSSAIQSETASNGYHGLNWLESGRPPTEDPGFIFSILQFTAFNNKLFISCSYKHEHKRLQCLFVVFSNGVFVHTVAPACRNLGQYDTIIDIPSGATYEMKLGFEFDDGSRLLVQSPTNGEGNADSAHKIFHKFEDIAGSLKNPRVLEIGSRSKFGMAWKWFLPTPCQYVGFDIKEGENVDVVGDAHFLSSYFPENSFDLIYSFAVFEHLMVPWKVAIEMNRVMAIGAIGFVIAPQAYPLHEQPSDFFRFSDMAWHAIFNRLTGFEIIGAGMSDRVYIVPANINPVNWRIDECPAYAGSNVLFRKVAESSVDWPIDTNDLMESVYPG
jgi:tetratricopeptide (TPR) repeat protein